MNSKMYLSWLGVAAILALVLIGSVALKSKYGSQPQTTNSEMGKTIQQNTMSQKDIQWKVYKNIKDKYQISIPSDWKIGENSGDLGTMFVAPDTQKVLDDYEARGNYGGEGINYDLSITQPSFKEMRSNIELNYGKTVASQIKNLPDYFLADPGSMTWDHKVSTVNGYTSYNITEGGLGVSFVTYIDAGPKGIYKILFTDFYSGADQNKEMIKNHIIQSFKLLK